MRRRRATLLRRGSRARGGVRVRGRVRGRATRRPLAITASKVDKEDIRATVDT